MQRTLSPACLNRIQVTSEHLALNMPSGFSEGFQVSKAHGDSTAFIERRPSVVGTSPLLTQMVFAVFFRGFLSEFALVPHPWAAGCAQLCGGNADVRAAARSAHTL